MSEEIRLGLDTDSGGWLSDAWGGFKNVLEDGISIWQDIETFKRQPIYTPTTTTAQPYYSAPPVDSTAIANANEVAAAAARGTWVPGVRNEFVVLGGIATVLGLLYVANR